MRYSEPTAYAKRIDGVFLPANELRPLVLSQRYSTPMFLELANETGEDSSYSWWLVEGEEYHHTRGRGGWWHLYTVLESADGPLLMSFEYHRWYTGTDDFFDEGLPPKRITYLVKQGPLIDKVEEYLASRPKPPKE